MCRISVNGQEEQFLLYDNGVANDNKILIFGTQKNLELLGSSDHWYAAGTFNTTPPLFSQVYTIQGVKFNNCILSVFVLLTGKTELIYQQMIQALKEIKPNLEPITIMMNFERFETEFPGYFKTGCFFHLSQCIWRKVQENGKAARYANDAVFALQVKMLSGLGFLPTQDVIPGCEKLTDSQYYINDDDLQSISDYFEDVWIGRLNRRFQRPHYFHPYYGIAMKQQKMTFLKQITLWKAGIGVLRKLYLLNIQVFGNL
ncbi:hypothetical protein RN001_000354 [Aquatica leii]|uniref:MULE transposase domain-containing protein n=1 Tax=Aquatica leii TaxID=1421715 RepID=A0AAN7SQI8_9COLE|nr:hypothetical protein RN001_000354 [Aquatica leii]